MNTPSALGGWDRAAAEAREALIHAVAALHGDAQGRRRPGVAAGSELVRRLDELYREELANGCAAARDDERYGRAVVEACAYWTLRTTGWHLPGGHYSAGRS